MEFSCGFAVNVFGCGNVSLQSEIDGIANHPDPLEWFWVASRVVASTVAT
jgi:hypothetical protein